MRLPIFLFTLALAIPALAADAPANKPDLVGEWKYKNDFVKSSAVLLPDGRYSIQTEAGGQKLSENGTYTASDGVFTATPRGGTPRRYKLVIDGESLALTDDAGTKFSYTRRPGSAKDVIAEAARLDEKKAAEDAAWAAKFPTAKARPMKILAIGDVPEDPTPGNTFADATTFQQEQIYTHFWNINVHHTVLRGPDPGSGKSQTRYYLFPNGRFLYLNIAYTGGEHKDDLAHPGTVTVTKIWGKYKIDADPKSETVSLITDKGETLSRPLIDGRRNLIDVAKPGAGDSIAYSNVLWITEQLK